jgi:hypothetical protein
LETKHDLMHQFYPQYLDPSSINNPKYELQTYQRTAIPYIYY